MSTRDGRGQSRSRIASARPDAPSAPLRHRPALPTVACLALVELHEIDVVPVIRASDGRRVVIRLVLRKRYDHIHMTMQLRPARRLFALLLGFVFALGISLSAVQASNMTVQMALASAMGVSGHDGCGGCTDDHGAQSGTCQPACTVAAVGILPSVAVVAKSPVLQLPSPADLYSSGRASLPDPSPPRAA